MRGESPNTNQKFDSLSYESCITNSNIINISIWNDNKQIGLPMIIIYPHIYGYKEGNCQEKKQ